MTRHERPLEPSWSPTEPSVEQNDVLKGPLSLRNQLLDLNKGYKVGLMTPSSPLTAALLG